MKIWLIIPIVLFSCVIGFSQKNAVISGKVMDESGNPLEFANVSIPDLGLSVPTDERGKYKLEVPANKNLTIEFSYVGYVTLPKNSTFDPGEKKTINVSLKKGVDFEEVIIKDNKIEDKTGTVDEIDVKELELKVNPSMNLDISQIAIGVTGSADELSSQYSVRGGSYDENLVYVNDFEIYRPFLVRSGRQEGLTFPNIDLIRSLAFSAGGFQARYGDKLSSVLDIKYKRPDSIRGSAQVSALGASAHIEGSIKKKNKKNQQFGYLIGGRYKTTRYLLGSLDQKGEYLPNFYDVQGSLSYDLSKNWQIGLIGNFNRSVYNFQPKSQETTLGLINLALRFQAFFDGQEVDDFTTYMAGISLSHLPDSANYYIKFLASTFQSRENERIDIIGAYRLGVLETDLGSEDAGEITATIGAGVQHNYARNFLTATVSNFAIKGGWERTKEKGGLSYNSTHLRYGAKYQNELIDDDINEWERLDSAGYSLPYSDVSIENWEVVKTQINLSSNRASAYVQNTWKMMRDSIREYGFTLGVRSSYWDLNEEVIITPRAQFYYKPYREKNDLLLKASVGMYYQPPFYRELRNLDGSINYNLKAQKSIHGVLGLVYDFKMWNRDFRFITEGYYKSLFDVVAFDIDNVRIRYYGDNNVKGYSTGIDFRINGEFAEGQESWVNLSFLRSRERFVDVQHLARGVAPDTAAVAIKDVPRPTDQFATLSIFFQDYLPKLESFKVNIGLVFGTGLAFGIPRNNVIYRNTYRYSPYYRADIGFSYLLWDAKKSKRAGSNPFRNFRRAWISAEVFNLLGVANAASHTWIKTVQNQNVAVPNYLTSRRVNVKVRFNF